MSGYCERCGSPLDDAAGVCRACSAGVEALVPTPPAETAEAPQGVAAQTLWPEAESPGGSTCSGPPAPWRDAPSGGRWFGLPPRLVILVLTLLLGALLVGGAVVTAKAVLPTNGRQETAQNVGAGAVVAPTAVPTTSSPEEKAQDADAQVLLWNAMTAIQSAFVDTQTFDPAKMTPSYLRLIESSMTYVPVSPDGSFSVTARAKDNAVNYRGQKANYTVGTTSESGRVIYVVSDMSRGEARYFWVDTDGTTREGRPGGE